MRVGFSHNPVGPAPGPCLQPSKIEESSSCPITGNTPLHLTEDPNFARRLIELHPPLLETKNKEGETPFGSALRRTVSAPWGRRVVLLELLQVFLRQGAALPSDENHSLVRELLGAIINFSSIELYNALKQLIDQGIDWQNSASVAGLLEGIIGAAIASRLGMLSPTALIDQLLKAGVELNRDNRGNTPLHLTEVPDFARQLIELRPHLLKTKNKEGETPFGSALRRAGYAPWEKKVNFLKLVQVFLQQDAALSPEENYFSRQLLEAVVEDNSMKQLIDQGIDWQNFASMAELLESVTVAALSNDHGNLSPSALLDQLFKAGVTLSSDIEGNTPLHLAKDPTFAKLLIEHQPSLLHTENKRGETPLMSMLKRATSSASEEKKDFRYALRNSLQVLQVFVHQGAALPPDEDRAALRAFLKAAVQNHSFATIIEQLIDEAIDWSECVTGEELLKRVVDITAPDSSLGVEHRFSALSSLLLNAGCSLKNDALKNILLNHVYFYTNYSYELIHLIEKREAGSIHAIDPEGEILQRLVEKAVLLNFHSNFKENKAFDLITLLMDMGFVLEGGWLRSKILAGFDKKRVRSCQKLIEFMEKRETGSLHAIDPEGEILKRLVEGVVGSNRGSDNPEKFDLMTLLMHMGSTLEKDWLRNCFLAGLQRKQTYGCHEIVKWMEKREAKSVHAIDPKGEIFQDLVVRVLSFPEYSAKQGLTLLEELLDLGFDLEASELKNILLREIATGTCFAYQEFIRLFQRKRESKWLACDPEQEILNAVLNRVFDDTPMGNPEWGSLLVDLGFEPTGDFLERFLAIPLDSSYFTSKFKEVYEHLIRAQKEPIAKNDPEGALVAMVVRAIHAHAFLGVIRLYGAKRLPKMNPQQFYMGILDSLLAAGAVIPAKVDGMPLSELLDTPGLEQAREAIALVPGKRMTKSARKNID